MIPCTPNLKLHHGIGLYDNFDPYSQLFSFDQVLFIVVEHHCSSGYCDNIV